VDWKAQRPPIAAGNGLPKFNVLALLCM